MDPELRDRWLDRAEQRLVAAGLRAGAGRTETIEMMAREGQCLISANELVERLRSAGSTGAPATVYRSLDTLLELGLLHRIDGRDGVARYEIADPERHHHHFVDEETGEVLPFADENLELAIKAVAENLGATLSGHDVTLRGRRANP